MLQVQVASPSFPGSFSPQQLSESTSQYRPTRDLAAFNSLLPPPIEFIEGSSSGALAVLDGKYHPINGTPKAAKIDHSSHVTPAKAHTSSPPLHTKDTHLYTGTIDSTWPHICTLGSGLYNTGNTCFLNSALQCLLHTPPLLRILLAHTRSECLVKSGFCMTCALREVMTSAHGANRNQAFTPSAITSKLQIIAKHMRRGRQEDSHEFLRYAIDALQKSCLAGHPPKLDPKVAETSWVHKVFGGRLRSRVTCHECKHNSDTFDSILDLSLDIYAVNSLKDALRKFVTVDYLKGADKYQCEKCKKAVIAEKKFTIHDAPLVLTVHFKRFSPMGRKIGHHVHYDDRLSLHPVMSEGQYGPSYSLYGVICHAGGGPNSGHYFAYVKAKDGRWHEMNDESVTPNRGAPVSVKNAYILFYLQDKGQALEAATAAPNQAPKASLAAGMKKRKAVESGDGDGEDTGVRASPPFIGPRLPSPAPKPDNTDAKRLRANSPDRQAELVKKKIEAVSKAEGIFKALNSYPDSDADTDGAGGADKSVMTIPSSPVADVPPTSSPDVSSASIPPARFYSTASGSKTTVKKRKSPDADEENRDYARTPLHFSSPKSKYGPSHQNGRHSNSTKRKSFSGGNPFARLSGSDNLSAGRRDQHIYGRKNRRPHAI